MIYTELRDLTRRRPFHPFRIHVDDGRVFDVRLLEQFLLTPSRIYVGLLSGETTADIGRVVIIDLEQVVSYEELPAPASTQGNGQGGG